MNINFLKKTGIVIAGALGAVYVLFLILPFIISPIANNYIPMVNDEIKKATGLNSRIENFRIVTTPKLTVGAKLGKFAILTPQDKEIFEAENFSVKMSLLPLLAKKIEIDLFQVDNIELKLGINKDGSFEIEKFIPTQTGSNTSQKEQTAEAPANLSLPFGLRLSNHLPDIKIGKYDIEFIDLSTGKKYEIEGDKTEITDLILNKSVKVLASGKAKLADREQFKYNIKINNKIMPDLDLHELVFNPIGVNEEEKNKQQASNFEINILDIFKGIYNNKITANLDADLTITKDGNSGCINADNLSIVDLPSSSANLKFKGHKIDIDSSLYTAQNEVSTINGFIQTGKKTNLDLNFKSQVQLNNIIHILNAIAMTFNIKDLQTLSANGKFDADFNIKSDLKTINSNGYFNIPNANIYYGLYKIGIDNINADVQLANNNIDIKNIGFSILNQPLKFYGLIKQDATADLHLVAENLSLKGLLVACGQAVLLKENPINSGTVSLKADIVGKLDKIKPTAKVVLNNIDIKNIPSNTTLKLPKTNIDIVADGQSFSGIATSENIKIINPAAGVIIPKISANIKPEEIEITQTPVKVEKINFNVSGKIKNYLTEKIALDFVTTGDIKAKLTGDMNVIKQTLNLIFATTSDSTIIVPMFDKSKMTFNGNIAITGNMINPILSGIINVPTLSIPEIPVIIDNLTAKLNGPILKGHATVGKFASGGIVAENCATDFSMKGVKFYLNNLKGTAFDGKINGNIIYNMSDFNTKVDFHGSGMNAEKAVAGAVGISNALSGTLGFDTNLTLKVVDYEDMIRSMRGKLNFKVENGSFGNIGRLENLFNASNIIGNALLKTTIATISNLSAVKNTAKYDYITGDMTFSNGWANISSIKSSGQTLAYFVYGKLHLINMSTNVTVLGRLDQSVVSLLGPVGELSADKLLSAIPKFGTLTASIANALTTNPKGERISEIPALSNGSENYKDFKVIFNGGLESSSSMKSFKWLTNVDTSALEPQQNMVETIKSLKTTVGDDVKNVVDTVKNQKEALKNTADELKNLFKF
ncbi:AsmA family protein [bacterium]|nr:AsmA family protein [bacterium]